MELLNKYITKEITFESDIVFITTNNTIVRKDLFMIDKHSAYLDYDGYLDNIYKQCRLKRIHPSILDEEIDDIVKYQKYYSYVKVLDSTNKDIIGKIFAFVFTKSVYEKISEYLNNHNKFENVFHLMVTYDHPPFMNYSHSYFKYEKCEIIDYSLDINDIIKTKIYVPPLIKQRIEKINKIKERICTRQ